MLTHILASLAEAIDCINSLHAKTIKTQVRNEIRAQFFAIETKISQCAELEVDFFFFFAASELWAVEADVRGLTGCVAEEERADVLADDVDAGLCVAPFVDAGLALLSCDLEEASRGSDIAAR